jgi:hypothetical protein
MGSGIGKKRKAPAGTWLERDVYMSRAYLELKGFAPQLLVLFLAKRDIDRDRKVRNKTSITMTYIELENIYHRREAERKGIKLSGESNLPRGISRPRIIRAIEQLLAHGFIDIVHRGGAYQQDKTVYALTDDWQWWRPGVVLSRREPDLRQRGYNGRKSNVAHETVPIHTHETVPIGSKNEPC